ncbi:hypothetical protein BXO25_12795, partial [Xanthomonas oryzae pv. oryzae]
MDTNFWLERWQLGQTGFHQQIVANGKALVLHAEPIPTLRQPDDCAAWAAGSTGSVALVDLR